MVLYNEVEQVGGFFFDAGIEFFTAKGLVDGTQGAFEALVLLQTE